MAADAKVYIESKLVGRYRHSTIEQMHEEYYENALELAKDAEWDEIILYAIYLFDLETEELISADFMSLCIPFEDYVKLCKKLSKGCRLFIINSRRDL